MSQRFLALVLAELLAFEDNDIDRFVTWFWD